MELRRQPVHRAMLYRFGEFSLDMERFELRCGGDPVAVEPQVLSLLAFMAARPGRLITREEIIDGVWQGRIISESALSSQIKSVRRAIGDDGRAQRYVRTVHGRGFRFEAEVATIAAGVASPAETGGDPDAIRTMVNSSGQPADPQRRTSVAVLPFANLSGDAAQDYFADGITADIITALAKYRWIGVLSRNTTFGYKNMAADIRQIASDLDVDYMVEGTVRRSGDFVRITAQLVDGKDGNSLWSERYDRELKDIFAVQDEITAKISASLEPAIGAAERDRVGRLRERDLRAWDKFHLGIAHFYRFTAPDNSEARRLLQASRELDPTFGEAHAWWAYATVLGMVYWEIKPSPELLDSALEAANTALKIDDQNAVFYMLKARVLLARREYEGALAQNRIAIEMNPSFAAAHCGLGDCLAYGGDYSDAIGCFERALALSPNDPQRWAFLSYGALALIFAGEYERAVAWADAARQIPNCQYWTAAHKAVALAYLGRTSDAQACARQLLAEQPGFNIAFATEKLFYLRRPEQVQLYLDGLQQAGIA